MYFTPDGRYAIVVAERLHRLDFRDAHTFKLHHSLHVPCSGVDHMDFSADGQLRHRQLRVLGPDAEGRHAPRARRRRADAACRRRAAGREALAGREGVLRRRHELERRLARRRRHVPRAPLHADRARRARPVSEPRRALPLRDEPRRGLDLRHLVRDAAHRARRGTSPAAAAPTWGTSPPTGRCCG